MEWLGLIWAESPSLYESQVSYSLCLSSFLCGRSALIFELLGHFHLCLIFVVKTVILGVHRKITYLECAL